MPPFEELEGEDRRREEVAEGGEELGVEVLRAEEAQEAGAGAGAGACAAGTRSGSGLGVEDGGDGAVVCGAETADAGADEPEEGRGVFGVVEEVGEVEGDDGEVVCGVDGGVDVAEEPLVVVEKTLADCWVWREVVAWVVSRAAAHD